ncbi:MAG: MerR family transcriptional regulator [Candidatus Tectomicrobia bacterium]|uniref:MerR family transcriptional regulator n=1 Tax=Tectimicrobiota bacterium TaxID=2528274 RepID=A0A932GNR3_UNCTE|nr:MerR family transcriptional regulator [Candidatus Tectomicrobia bacterium]
MATIPDKLFFKIGEVAEVTGVEPHVLRYWETEFPQLRPIKNRAGQRTYQRKDVETVMEIKRLLYAEKFTIAGARKHFGRSSSTTEQKQLPLGFTDQELGRTLAQCKKELESILQTLDTGPEK